jgi:hypothetical protein
MVIAMAVVGMVQVAVDEVIDVVAVGHGGVTAIRPVNMACFVAATRVAAATGVWIGRSDAERVLFDLTTLDGMM